MGLVDGLIEPEAWTLPSPRKPDVRRASRGNGVNEQPILCQPQTEEVLSKDRFSSPKRNYRTAKGRHFQREMCALRAEIESTKEMFSCRFSGERTDFASLQGKLSSFSLSSVHAPSASPRRTATRSPEAEVESLNTARLQEPKAVSTPPRRRSPSPQMCPISARGLPQAHAGLYSAVDPNRFCGLCACWYAIGAAPHNCAQSDLADPLSETMEHVNNTDVEKQVDDRMQHFAKVQRMTSCDMRLLRNSPLGNTQIVRRMQSCESPMVSTLDHGNAVECLKPDQKLTTPESVPEMVSHVKNRGAELRDFGNEIDALAADLLVLEGEIKVACPV